MNAGPYALSALFFCGVVARRMGWIDARHGAALLRLLVVVALPALLLGSLAPMEFEAATRAVPVVAIVAAVALLPLTVGAARALAVSASSEGAMVAGALSMNLAFVYPFAAAAGGHDLVARFVLFDAGNAVMQFTLLSFAAARYGRGGASLRGAFVRAAQAPPLWALVTALLLNVTHAPVAAAVYEGLAQVGRALLLAGPFAIGVVADFGRLRSVPVWLTVVLRSAAGAAVGAAIAWVFGLDAAWSATVTIGCAAPIGYFAVMLAAREQLDVPLAAAAAAVSAFAAALWLPLALAAAF